MPSSGLKANSKSPRGVLRKDNSGLLSAVVSSQDIDRENREIILLGENQRLKDKLNRVIDHAEETIEDLNRANDEVRNYYKQREKEFQSEISSLQSQVDTNATLSDKLQEELEQEQDRVRKAYRYIERNGLADKGGKQGQGTMELLEEDESNNTRPSLSHTTLTRGLSKIESLWAENKQQRSVILKNNYITTTSEYGQSGLRSSGSISSPSQSQSASPFSSPFKPKSGTRFENQRDTDNVINHVSATASEESKFGSSGNSASAPSSPEDNGGNAMDMTQTNDVLDPNDLSTMYGGNAMDMTQDSLMPMNQSQSRLKSPQKNKNQNKNKNLNKERSSERSRRMSEDVEDLLLQEEHAGGELGALRERVRVRSMFKGLLLYTVGILCHIECYVRQL